MHVFDQSPANGHLYFINYIVHEDNYISSLRSFQAPCRYVSTVIRRSPESLRRSWDCLYLGSGMGIWELWEIPFLDCNNSPTGTISSRLQANCGFNFVHNAYWPFSILSKFYCLYLPTYLYLRPNTVCTKPSVGSHLLFLSSSLKIPFALKCHDFHFLRILYSHSPIVFKFYSNLFVLLPITIDW